MPDRKEEPNIEMLEAIEEVKRLKADPDKKVYNSFEEMVEEIEKE